MNSNKLWPILLVSLFILSCQLGCDSGGTEAEKEEIIEELLISLQSDSPEVRIKAAEELEDWGHDNLLVVSALFDALQDEESLVREAAAHSLYILNPKSVESMQKLIGALNDESYIVQGLAASTLRKMGPAAMESIPYLMALTKSEDVNVRLSAVNAIINIDPPMLPEVIDVIAYALNNEDDNARNTAAVILRSAEYRIPEKGIIALTEALSDSVIKVRTICALTLGNQGSDAAIAVPTLVKILEDNNWAVRAEAAKAIGKIGVVNEAVIQSLLRALDDQGKDGSVRYQAATSLGQLGSGAERVLPKLQELAANDELEAVRKAARDAIEQITVT